MQNPDSRNNIVVEHEEEQVAAEIDEHSDVDPDHGACGAQMVLGDS